MLLLLSASLFAQGDSQTPPPSILRTFERLEWRSSGPANMGGRTADVEGVSGKRLKLIICSRDFQHALT